MARPSSLYVISISVHVGIGIAVAAVPARKVIESYQVMISPAQPPAPKPAENPPPQPARQAALPETRVGPRRLAKPMATPTADSNSGAASSEFAVPDFGVALGNFGAGEGIEVPVPQPRAAELPVVPVKKALSARRQSYDQKACREAVVKARVVQVRKPTYSVAARQAGVTGKVRLRVSLDAEGRVTEVRVIDGLGFGLDESALAAVRQAEYAPATRCGRAVASTFHFAVRFGV